jgi:hypothetical protein
MNVHETAAWIRGVNESNGFDAPAWDNLPVKMMLVVTELNEACDGVHGTGQDPLAEELADTAIRLLDILGSLWTGDWSDRRWGREVDRVARGNVQFQPIETVLWRPLRYCCLAVESWRHENRDDTRIAIELALRETLEIGRALKFDMAEEIERKVLRNMGRGQLHGKKRADG